MNLIRILDEQSALMRMSESEVPEGYPDPSVGDQITVTDGEGREFTAWITRVDREPGGFLIYAGPLAGRT